MKKFPVLLVLGMCSLWLTAGPAWAQSSGNFTYNSQGASLNCVLGSNGSITGGVTCSAGTCATDSDCSAVGGTCQSGTCVTSCTKNTDCLQGQTCTNGTCGGGCVGSFDAGIKTNSGSGNVFDIRPSAVIGLLTDVSINKITQSSSALAGVDFQVNVTGSGVPAPTLAPAARQWVTYDSRFIQISSNLFNALTASCVTTSTTAGAGCFFTFDESTVSAHSFDWIASNLQSGTYTVTANWKASYGNSGISQALTCVGPVNLTVEQNKVFNFNTVNPM